MSESFTQEPLLDMYIFETTQLIEQLEQEIISSEKSCGFTNASVNEIFRIMHTIKGSSSTMLYNNIATLAHSMEDLFYYIRENKPRTINYTGLSDIVLEGVDYIKAEVDKITDRKVPDEIDKFLADTIFLKGYELVTSPVKALSNQNKAYDDKENEPQTASAHQSIRNWQTVPYWEMEASA